MVTFDKTVGQADTIWPDLRLGQTYGWGTEIYRTGRRKRQKEAGMKISEAICTNRYTGPSCDKQVQNSKNMHCKSCECGRLKRLLRPSSSASNASLVVCVLGLICVSHTLPDLLSSTDLN